MEDAEKKVQPASSKDADASVPQGDEDEVECRCKESKKKSLKEILLTALRDLMFWKR
jgi:hypothetical protein